MNRSNETAKQAYDRNHAAALKALAVIQKELKKIEKDPNWGQVGDLAYVVERLNDISDQFTGSGQYAS